MEPSGILTKLSQAISLPSSGILWLGYLAILILFGVITVIFMYHWRTYAFDEGIIKMVTRLYLAISIILLAGMAIFLAIYS